MGAGTAVVRSDWLALDLIRVTPTSALLQRELLFLIFSQTNTSIVLTQYIVFISVFQFCYTIVEQTLQVEFLFQYLSPGNIRNYFFCCKPPILNLQMQLYLSSGLQELLYQCWYFNIIKSLCYYIMKNVNLFVTTQILGNRKNQSVSAIYFI